MSSKLVKKNQVAPVDRIMDRMFGSLFSDIFDESFLTRGPTLNSPPLNIIEREGGYDVQLAVPGFKKEDIGISVKDDLLTISGKSTTEKVDEKFVHREVSMSQFARSITLPQGAQTDAIRASHEDGVLTVSIPTNNETRPSLDIKID